MCWTATAASWPIPNCSTIQMVVALAAAAHGLWPGKRHRLHLSVGLRHRRQRCCGAGSRSSKPASDSPDSPYPHAIAFNALPHIDVFDGQGWSGEERKMIAETRKIMGLPSLHVVPTTVRVPVRVGHSESVYARFSRPISVSDARRVLQEAPGVIVQDDPAGAEYPLAIQVAGRDEVFVGRLRQDPEDDHALLLWVVGDNLRKGAATNAVQIGEIAMAQVADRGREAQYV